MDLLILTMGVSAVLAVVREGVGLWRHRVSRRTIERLAARSPAGIHIIDRCRYGVIQVVVNHVFSEADTTGRTEGHDRLKPE